MQELLPHARIIFNRKAAITEVFKKTNMTKTIGYTRLKWEGMEKLPYMVRMLS